MLGLQLYQPYAEFMEYLTLHGKSYVTMEEFETRRSMYLQTDELIKAHNSSDSSFKLGHNQFSDMTDYERSKLSGFKYCQKETAPVLLDVENMPAEVDWRTKGAVTPVKNQGSCGSCWAFSATGALEGSNFIQTGELESFSEQQLIDCANRNAGYDCSGCAGGWAYQAFEYYKKFNAVTEADYPYVGIEGLYE